MLSFLTMDMLGKIGKLLQESQYLRLMLPDFFKLLELIELFLLMYIQDKYKDSLDQEFQLIILRQILLR